MNDGHGHGHEHGHADDRGLAAMWRYLRHAPRMWRSVVNDATIAEVGPRAGEQVVDIGAGMGPASVAAARAGASVVAVEPTPFMRRILVVRRLLQRARDRIEIVDGAAEHLPVEDDSTDAVVSVNTMHHWVDAREGAVEIARVLRPGGRVVLVDEDFEDPEHPEYERFGADHGHDDHDHDGDDDHDGHDDHEGGHHHGFTMVDAEQMGELLEAAGLVDVDASRRRLADRPVIAVTARAAERSAET